MGNAANENYSRFAMRPPLHDRARILAAKRRQSLVDLADELFGPALDRAEEELSRLKGEKPSRAGAID